MSNYFTGSERENVLDLIASEAAAESRFVGCVLVGSGAVGFADQYSDIDIVIVAASSVDVHEISEAWKKRLLGLLPVLGYARSIRAERVILHNFYLTNYLEINNSIVPLDVLTARGERYKVLWDRTGTIQQRLDESWAKTKVAKFDGSPELLRTRQAEIWHFVNHAYVALQRGQVWSAISDIEEIRRQIIEMHAGSLGLESKRNRDVDEMEPWFKAKIADLLCGETSVDLLSKKLKTATSLFFDEIRAAIRSRDLVNDDEKMEAALLELLD
jgi:predicted nucleotidyltransferase